MTLENDIQAAIIEGAVAGAKVAIDQLRTRMGRNQNSGDHTMKNGHRPNNTRYWWGKAHRARLTNTGQYIKTSQQTRITIVLGTPQPRTLRIGEEIGKLIKFSQEES